MKRLEGESTVKTQGNRPWTFTDMSSYFASYITAGKDFVGILTEDGSALAGDDCLDLVSLPSRHPVQLLLAVDRTLYGQSDSFIYEWKQPHLQANTAYLLRKLACSSRYSCLLHTWSATIFHSLPHIGSFRLTPENPHFHSILSSKPSTEYPFLASEYLNPRPKLHSLDYIASNPVSTGDNGLETGLGHRLRREQEECLGAVDRIILKWRWRRLKEVEKHYWERNRRLENGVKAIQRPIITRKTEFFVIFRNRKFEKYCKFAEKSTLFSEIYPKNLKISAFQALKSHQNSKFHRLIHQINHKFEKSAQISAFQHWKTHQKSQFILNFDAIRTGFRLFSSTFKLLIKRKVYRNAFSLLQNTNFHQNTRYKAISLLENVFFRVNMREIMRKMPIFTSKSQKILHKLSLRRRFEPENPVKSGLKRCFSSVVVNKDYYCPEESGLYLSEEVFGDISYPAELDLTPTDSVLLRKSANWQELPGKHRNSLSRRSLKSQGTPYKYTPFYKRQPWLPPHHTGAAHPVPSAKSRHSRRMNYSLNLRSRILQCSLRKQATDRVSRRCVSAFPLITAPEIPYQESEALFPQMEIDDKRPEKSRVEGEFYPSVFGRRRGQVR